MRKRKSVIAKITFLYSAENILKEMTDTRTFGEKHVSHNLSLHTLLQSGCVMACLNKQPAYPDIPRTMRETSAKTTVSHSQ